MADRTSPSSINVLLAEDDDDFRGLIASDLTRRGFHVDCVRDGRELADAIASLVLSHRRTRPDVILSDIRMPGPSGLQLLGAVHEAALRIPVVLMTAFADPRLDHADVAHDAAAVLTKPFELSELDAVLRAAAAPSTGARVCPPRAQVGH